MKLTTLLSRDHREVLGMLTELEAAVAVLEKHPGDKEASEVVVRAAVMIESEVAAHFGSEETLLFPRLDEIPGMSNGPLKMMRYEHERFRELATAFQEQAQMLRADGPIDVGVMATVVSELVALLKDHINKEDRVLFPMCQRYLGDLTLEAMGRAAESASRAAKWGEAERRYRKAG